MIITNSHYALVGYFITSYPTRAHGLIVIYFTFGFRIMTVISRNSLYRGIRYIEVRYIEVRYIEVLFHTFHCNFGRDVEYRSLYGGLR